MKTPDDLGKQWHIEYWGKVFWLFLLTLFIQLLFVLEATASETHLSLSEEVGCAKVERNMDDLRLLIIEEASSTNPRDLTELSQVYEEVEAAYHRFCLTGNTFNEAEISQHN